MAGPSVHDPVHGTIPVGEAEMAVVDTREVQRLRFVKQLGFAEMAFPGATHSRLSHSLGAMHMAGRMFDAATSRLPLEADQRHALRLATRLAVLLHDVGHPPFSHASEVAMPAISALGLGTSAPGPASRRASHEDYTHKIILDSPVAGALEAAAGAAGVGRELVAALVVGADGQDLGGGERWLDCAGRSLLPLLTAIVSGELDADRMDYLRRDAHFCGVSYGHFDHLWLTANMVALGSGDAWVLGLEPRAIWALEDFLLARYHMFSAVYYHHTAVAFDTMLAAWFDEEGFAWPGEVTAYLAHDDPSLWVALRRSPSRWARALVARRPLTLLGEARTFGDDPGREAAGRLDAAAARLRSAGLSPLRVASDSLLSRYGRPGGRQVPLFMCEADGRGPRPVSEATPLYRRFAQSVRIERLFGPGEEGPAARALLATSPTGGGGAAGQESGP